MQPENQDELERLAQLHWAREIAEENTEVLSELSGTPWREVFSAEIAEVGEGVLALRGALNREGLTGVDLSVSTGMTLAHIEDLMSGKSQISETEAQILAHFLNVDYRIFLEKGDPQ